MGRTQHATRGRRARAPPRSTACPTASDERATPACPQRGRSASPGGSGAWRRRDRRPRRPCAAASERKRTAVSSPSPVVAYRRKITCPLCSPPSTHPSRPSPRARSGLRPAWPRRVMPRIPHRALEAEVRHDGRDHGVARQRRPPRASPIAHAARTWSPSITVPAGVGEQRAVGVAVVGDAGVGAERAGPRAATTSGCRAPQPTLMFSPVGRGMDRVHRRRRGARTASGARSEAAPFAQSTTIRIPSSGRRPPSTRCARYRSRPPLSDPDRAVDAEAPERDRRGPPRSCLRRVGQLHPVAREELDPVVLGGVVRGADDDAGIGAGIDGQERDRRAWARPRPGARRRPASWIPLDERVLEPDARLSRVPTQQEDGTVLGLDSEHCHGCPAQVVRELRGELGAGDTPDPVGPEETRHGQVMLPVGGVTRGRTAPRHAALSASAAARWAAVGRAAGVVHAGSPPVRWSIVSTAVDMLSDVSISVNMTRVKLLQEIDLLSPAPVRAAGGG